MHLNQLQAIVEIARSGSFRKASALLGRSQPSLTRLILQLEEEIGFEVFDRSPTGAQLTEHGARVHARALSVLAELARMEDEVSQLRESRRGTVRLAVSPAGGTSLLPKALRQFRKHWPQVNVDALDTLYPESMNMLRNGQLEMVVGPTPEQFSDPALLVEKLSKLKIVLVTHRGNPLRSARQLTELAQAVWFVHGPDLGPSTLFASKNPFLNALYVTRCHSLTTLLAAIVENEGFAFLSDELFFHLERRYDLVTVPISDPLPELYLSVSTRRNMPLTPAAETLLTHLKRQAVALHGAGAVPPPAVKG